MISQIAIRNFKSLKNASFDLRGVNVLAGLNGMGKSSCIQAMLLMRQSPNIANGELQLNNGSVKIGTGKDALNQSSDSDFISLQLTTNEQSLQWDFLSEQDNDVLISEQRYRKEQLEGISIFNHNFHYITADRLAQKEFHEASLSNVNKGNLGSRGEYVVHFLELAQTGSGEQKYLVPLTLRHPSTNDSDLKLQTEAWLGEISPNVRLNINKISSDTLQLGFTFGSDQTRPFKPSNVGFGISYTLSVVVALLTATPDKLIIIENPEAHLHPRGQSKLAGLMARAARTGAQIILETHSDHILNGIRVAVREYFNDERAGKSESERRGASDEDVAIFWFDRNGDGSGSEVFPVHIEPNGKIKRAPIGFFDQMDADLDKILGLVK